MAIVKLNKENAQQKVAVQQAENHKSLYLLVSLFLALLLVVGIWVYIKLRNQQKELASINQVKNRLFSIIAHDLRGMLIPFQRAGRILNYHIEKGNHHRTIELSKELEKNSNSLSNMLDNLLNWSLEQMNGYKAIPQKMLVGEQLKGIIAVQEKQALYKNSQIILEYEEELSVLFDKGAFNLVLRNLISNAIKYTENGKIIVTFFRKSNKVCCLVEDTGVGMSDKQLSELFSVNNMTTTIGTKGEKGTGLGLNLAYRFVKMYDGTIIVSSKLSKGTKFEVCFPLRSSIEVMDKKEVPQLESI